MYEQVRRQCLPDCLKQTQIPKASCEKSRLFLFRTGARYVLMSFDILMVVKYSLAYVLLHEHLPLPYF